MPKKAAAARVEPQVVTGRKFVQIPRTMKMNDLVNTARGVSMILWALSEVDPPPQWTSIAFGLSRAGHCRGSSRKRETRHIRRGGSMSTQDSPFADAFHYNGGERNDL